MNLKLQREVAPYVHSYESFIELDELKAKPAINGKRRDITEKEKIILAKAAETWQEYSKTERGVAQLKSMETMDLEQAQKSVKVITDDPLFQDLKNFINEFDLDELVNSFSISVGLQASFMFGAGVSVGQAIGICESEGEQSSFLCVGASFGSKGITAHIDFTLWVDAPEDLQGRSWCVEFDAGYIIGGGVKTYFKDDEEGADILGFGVMLGTGVSVNPSAGWSYTWVFASDPGEPPIFNPVYQSREGKPNLLYIEEVKCIDEMEGNTDEVYIAFCADPDPHEDTYPLVNPHFHPPYNYYGMDEGNEFNEWKCGRTVWFKDSVFVSLWDDYLGDRDNPEPIINCMIRMDNLKTNGDSVTFVMENDKMIKGVNYKETEDGTPLYHDSGSNEVKYELKVRLLAVG